MLFCGRRCGSGVEVLVGPVLCGELASSGEFWRGGVGCSGCCRRRGAVGSAAAGRTSDVDGSAGRWSTDVERPRCRVHADVRATAGRRSYGGQRAADSTYSRTVWHRLQ